MTDENRKYDIVVFGASGVTGEVVVEELALHNPEVNWCVAGRNKEKLKFTLEKLGKEINKNLDHVDILEADCGDEASITRMCQSARLLINCVGPYRFTGEKMVEHCVKNKTHCVDVSGEPQYLETVQLKYFDEAKAKEIFIVGCCGFDSIPCDMGVEVIRKKFDGDLNSVETFLSAKLPPGSTVNFGTWQSAIYGLAHSNELKPLRKALKEKLFSKGIPKPDYSLKPRGRLFRSKIAKGWCMPFIGSDRSVVLRTQMFNHQFKNERPVQIQTYVKMYSLLYALVAMLMGGIFMLLTKFALGRDLLEKFPEMFSLGVFSRTPPKKDRNSEGSFNIVFKAKGWAEKLLDASDKHSHPPNKTLTATLRGPDPGYITTSICVVSAARVILDEKDKLPLKGGVFTPGAAFSNTTLMDKLAKRGITMTVTST